MKKEKRILKNKTKKKKVSELNQLLISNIIKANNVEYNKLKAVEEMTELNEVLIKSMTKRPDLRPDDKSVIEEIGDVFVRLNVIKHMYGAEAVDARIAYKQQKIAEAIVKNPGKVNIA